MIAFCVAAAQSNLMTMQVTKLCRSSGGVTWVLKRGKVLKLIHAFVTVRSGGNSANESFISFDLLDLVCGASSICMWRVSFLFKVKSYQFIVKIVNNCGTFFCTAGLRT